jgi:adenylate cyclase class IV
MLQALSTALGVRGVVRKHRHVILIDNTRVHLDEVEGLGSFIEFEVVLEESEAVSRGTKVTPFGPWSKAPQASFDDQTRGERIVAELLATLQIPASHLVRGAYIDLLEERELRA